MREDLRDYFQFSTSQSRAILFLSILSLLGIIAYFTMDAWIARPNASADNQAEMDKLLAEIYIDTNYHKQDIKPQKLSPFPFDPNTISAAGMIKLGLRPRLVKTIENYRNKGGRFYKADDFKKIWGLHEDEFRQLRPYISLAQPSRNYGHDYNKPNAKATRSIEINSATQEEFIALYGLGEKLANNIIKYRGQLGGFYHINQLKEVYGIRPETFEGIKSQLRCNANLVTKVNINAATLAELRTHPYLRQNDVALEITRFRKSQDYEIKALIDLKNVAGMTEELYDKIVPYLSLQ